MIISILKLVFYSNIFIRYLEIMFPMVFSSYKINTIMRDIKKELSHVIIVRIINKTIKF